MLNFHSFFSTTQMRIIIISIILIISSLQDGFSQDDNPAILRSIPLLKRFESVDYNGGIQSWAFDQDSSGFLYAANNMGLLEFDGNKWTRYDVPFCTRLRAVKVDDENKIFVGGQGQIGYFSMTENGLEFSSLLQLLPPDQQDIAETWKIFNHQQKIYFLTESQFFVYDGNAIQALQLPGYIQQAFKIGGQLMVQVYNAGLFSIIDDKFIPLEGTAQIPEIIAALPKSEGNYYFTKWGQIFEEVGDGYQEVGIPFEMGTITDAIKLSNGEFVVGTQNGGMYIFNSDLTFKQHLTKNEGLSDRTIKALYEDGFQNLWVALNNGIDYLELSLPLSLIYDEVGLEGTGYAACKFNDRVYLGTNNGLFSQKNDGDNLLDDPYALVPGSEGQVYNFSIVENDLILNHDRGAFQIENNKLKSFYWIGSWIFVPTAIPGLILGGDYRGISYYRKTNGLWTKIGEIPGLNESSRLMEFENDSTLWMSHGSKGVFRFKFDKKMNLKGDVEFYGRNDGFPSKNKISVYSLNGKLVFTSEKGIYDFNNNTLNFSPNSFFNKWLGTDHVNEIISNGDNTIYYIQDQKVGMLIQETFGTYKKETGIFKHINKLLNDDLPNISILDDKNVLIGAKEGFVLYNPAKEFSINENFKVIIRSVEIKFSDDSIINYSPLKVGNKEIAINQSIKFNYASPYFDGFEDLKYSYRLVPMNEKWTNWTPVGQKEYPYLPSGDYTFEVKALNVYGLESEVSSFSFKVLKPWYFSTWATVMYLFAGLMFVIFILLLQKRKHDAENSLITQKSEQAIKSKEEEIDQISKESKSKIENLISEKLRTEINLKNDQLTTITMHLMSNSDFLQNIRKKIEIYMQQGGDRKELGNLIKTIDDHLSDTNSWDQFAYHFDQVHSGYLKKLSENNVKLSPREIKLASFLRMNMSSKEISKLMNISDRGVELARYRLRKKMKLGRDQNLVEYLIDLDDT